MAEEDQTTNYQGNSKKEKENKDKEQKRQKPDDKKIEPIVTSPAIIKKKGIFRRAKDTLIEVDFKETVAHVIAEVLIPAAKEMIFDSIIDGAKYSIFGDRRGGRRSYSNERESHVVYNRGIDKGSRSMGISRYAPEREMGSRTQRYGINSIIIVERQEAIDIIDSMADAIEEWKVVSVADLNQMIGVTVRPIDHKWGWTRMDGISMHNVREGYLIELPEPESI